MKRRNSDKDAERSVQLTEYNGGVSSKIDHYSPTVFTISGYTGSESTPLPEVI